MRSFLQKLLIFSLPFVCLFGAYLLVDPFEVIHPEWPLGSEQPVFANADYKVTETYLRNRERIPYDAFLFGSSRTLAFPSRDWRRHLPDIVPLRYNANRETLFGVHGKVRLIDEQGDRIRHALLLVDWVLLDDARNSAAHLYIKHPRVSRESWGDFHAAFMSAWVADFFFVKYLDFALFGKFRPYMEGVIQLDRLLVDEMTNDLVLEGLEEKLAADPDAYYEQRGSLFADARRQMQSRAAGPVLRSAQKEMLSEIAEVLDRHDAQVQVVVSPNFDQVPLHPDDLEVLRELFGPARVHDYSGINEITREMRNYYEPYHYRPEVGRRILDDVYGSGTPGQVGAAADGSRRSGSP